MVEYCKPAQYVIVTSFKTQQLWPRALKALQTKYEEKWPGMVHLVTYDSENGVYSTLPALRQYSSSFTCFLEHHSLCCRQFVRHVNQLTRELDPSTVYGDTVWGILTGYVEDDVLFAVKQPHLTIRRATGNSPMYVKSFQSGLWFSESEKGIAIRKLPSEESEQREKCPDDVTDAFVRELSAWRDNGRDEGVDFIGTSGHATERDLQMGYCFNSGSICCNNGQLYGRMLNGTNTMAVQCNDSPKVLSAAGNCLMGHISDEDCMALGWMHSACVVQMTGYIVPTWFGYGGWGVNDYFCEEPGGMTFSQAFFSNQQALLYTLHSKHDKTPHEHEGLLHDRDNVAFYGDPAWSASLEKCSVHANYIHLVVLKTANSNGWSEWEYRLITQKQGKWRRPPVYVFPSRVRAVRLVSGGAIITCRFLLLPLTGEYGAQEQNIVTYQTLQ